MSLNRKAIFTAALAAVVAMPGMSAYAMTEHFTDASATVSSKTWADWKTKWDKSIKANLEELSLTPGADDTKLNLCWYSHTLEAHPSVKISKNANMSGAQTFTGTQTFHRTINGTKYYSSKVTVSGLAEETKYYYQYENNGKWSNAVPYTTRDFSDFKVIYVGDPQVGASVGRTPSDSNDAQTQEIAARNDSYNWNSTLNTALKKNPDASFLISAGDQINYSTKDDTPAQEIEYSGYLSADALKSLPEAPTIGNHDSQTTNYKNHFNTPNSFTAEKNPTAAGNDYYYSYGNALFMVLNTNNYNCADHEALIKKAIAANPNAKWRVVTFHQDVYGSGKDHSDSDGIILRTQLTPIMDKYGVDVVLQGHDHTYSRTFPITGDGLTHTSYKGMADFTAANNSTYLGQNNCYQFTKDKSKNVVNPKGTVYFTANSATGSKYYELINPVQDYIAARWQEWKPTYSVIEIKDDKFTINTYETETGKKIDNSFSIEKTHSPAKVSVTDSDKSNKAQNFAAVSVKKENNSNIFSAIINTIQSIYNYL